MQAYINEKYHFVWKGRVTLDGVQFWHPSLSSSADYVIKSTNSFSFKFKRMAELTSSLLYNKVHRTHSKNLLLTVRRSADYYFNVTGYDRVYKCDW